MWAAKERLLDNIMLYSLMTNLHSHILRTSLQRKELHRVQSLLLALILISNVVLKLWTILTLM